jgi:hypothetical protein
MINLIVNSSEGEDVVHGMELANMFQCRICQLELNLYIYTSNNFASMFLLQEFRIYPIYALVPYHGSDGGCDHKIKK